MKLQHLFDNLEALYGAACKYHVDQSAETHRAVETIVGETIPLVTVALDQFMQKHGAKAGEWGVGFLADLRSFSGVLRTVREHDHKPPERDSRRDDVDRHHPEQGAGPAS